jgi:hypothetical protein
MPAIRNARGHFVPKNNPLVVIGALNAMRAREREVQALQQQQDRRATARELHGVRTGYAGPMTRAELAALVTDDDDQPYDPQIWETD